MTRSRAAAVIAFAVVSVVAVCAACYWLLTAVLHYEAHPVLPSVACVIFGYCFGDTITRRVCTPLADRIIQEHRTPTTDKEHDDA